jgi:ribonuclease P protein component
MTNRDDFPPAARLLQPAEFARVYEARHSVARGPLVLYAALRGADGGRARLGLSVSRRIGNAVVRNRWKRHLREAFRRVQSRLNQQADYIVVVRSGKPAAGEEAARHTERALVDLAGRVDREPGQRR